MKINFEIDDAEIIQKVMSGLNTKQIEKNIVTSVVGKVTDRIAIKCLKEWKYSPTKKVLSDIKNDVKDACDKRFKELLKEEELMNSKDIDEIVIDFLYSMLEGYFEENPIKIEVKYGDLKKIATLRKS